MPPYPPWQRARAAERLLSQPKTADMSRKAAETPPLLAVETTALHQNEALFLRYRSLPSVHKVLLSPVS